MFQNNSYLVPSDNCGVWWVSIIHLYVGFSSNISSVGDFVNVSVNNTSPDNWLNNNTNTKGIIVSSNNELSNIDGSCVSFSVNNIVLLKNSTTPQGTVIFGPTLNNINSNNFLTSFPGII